MQRKEINELLRKIWLFFLWLATERLIKTILFSLQKSAIYMNPTIDIKQDWKFADPEEIEREQM
jgi:hypothetical protein